MDNHEGPPTVAIGVIVILVIAAAAVAVVLSGGVGGDLPNDFVKVLPFVAVPLFIVAVYLILRGGG